MSLAVVNGVSGDGNTVNESEIDLFHDLEQVSSNVGDRVFEC